MKDSIDIINKEIANCKKCRLWQGRTNVVPGEGNPKADILFIGEGPGRDEDLQGRPFVGAAGKFLTEMITSIGLTREDVYITNVVKCRPPQNRDPLEDEIKICTESYLFRQIKLISPLLIVTLGRHSLSLFFPKNFKISQIHGVPKKIVKKNGEIYNILPLYHPAAALYNGGLRETLMNDFKKIPKIIKKLKGKN